MVGIFITSSGTGIGKTLVTTALCWQLRQAGRAVTALKPIISGYTPGDQQSDSALILQSCGIAPTQEAISAISPWRYAAPLAPNMAAALEGNPVDIAALASFCRKRAQGSEICLVEGVGGVMAPLTDSHTVLDWMAALRWPVILVCGSYLGAISHALTSVEVLRARGLALKALIVSESAGSDVPLDATLATLKRFVPGNVPVISLPRLPVQEELWKHVPPIIQRCGL